MDYMEKRKLAEKALGNIVLITMTQTVGIDQTPREGKAMELQQAENEKAFLELKQELFGSSQGVSDELLEEAACDTIVEEAHAAADATGFAPITGDLTSADVFNYLDEMEKEDMKGGVGPVNKMVEALTSLAASLADKE